MILSTAVGRIRGEKNAKMEFHGDRPNFTVPRANFTVPRANFTVPRANFTVKFGRGRPKLPLSRPEAHKIFPSFTRELLEKNTSG